MPERLFVAGGMYTAGLAPGREAEFKLVRPTKGVPYVVAESWLDKLFNTTKHHAHLYLLSDHHQTVTLFRKSTEAEAAKVAAPEEQWLSPLDAVGVTERINAGDIFRDNPKPIIYD